MQNGNLSGVVDVDSIPFLRLSDDDDVDAGDADAGDVHGEDVDGDHVDRGDHDDNDDVVSDGGEVDDLHGDCSAWRLSLP